MQLPSISAPIAMIALLVAAAACGPPQANACPEPAVYHVPAGSCMNPAALEVSGDLGRVEAAISRHNGSVQYTTQAGHHVRFPVDDPVALDKIKDDLTRAGFEVQYSLVVDVH